jgi:hypothetical protein
MTNLCLERARLHSFLKEGVGGVVLKGGGDVFVAHGFIRAAKCPKMTRATSGLGTGPIGHNYTGVPDPRKCRSALPDDLAASRRTDERRTVRGTSRGLPCKSSVKRKREISRRATRARTSYRSGSSVAQQRLSAGGSCVALQNRTSICSLRLRRVRTED